MQNLSQGNPAQTLLGLLTNAVQALQSGDPVAAETPARKALSLAPKNPDCHLIMATISHNLNRPEEAETHYVSSLRLKPDNVRALINLGMLQLNDGRGDEAVPHLQKAVKLDSDSVEARHYLARALAQAGRLEEAVDQFAVVEKVLPDNVDLLLGYARAKFEMKGFTLALDLLQRVLDLEPDNHDALNRLGEIHAAQGDFDAAEAAYRAALKVSPGDLGTLSKLSAIRRLDDGDMEVLEANMLDFGTLKELEQVTLLFVMGTQFEEKQEFERAFKAYQQANDLLEAGSDYDAWKKSQYFEQLTLATVGAEITDWPKGSDSTAPVFIVGMPRSGTTLVEQILAAHPAVLAGGEQTTMTKDIVTLMKDDARFTPSVEDLNTDQLNDLAARYLEYLPEEAGAFERVTDKMPGNVELLPLIVRMFPNAKIILCRRHPMDVAWSIFKHRFHSDLNYATSLTNIAHQQKLTCSFMDHWIAEAPNRSLEICYELLTADFETHARKIVDFVGLEWDDACLEPHSVERAVHTASMWQVRQPVYQSSVGQWRSYEKQLSGTKEALSDIVSNYEAKVERGLGT